MIINCVCARQCARAQASVYEPRAHESNLVDVDLCGCEAYAELNDFNYQTASIEQSQAVALVITILILSEDLLGLFLNLNRVQVI